MKNEFRAITEEWTNKAESDFKFAKASLDEFGEFYSPMCLLYHDATEKYLKGSTASYGLKPERTHDLVTL